MKEGQAKKEASTIMFIDLLDGYTKVKRIRSTPIWQKRKKCSAS